jgi:hypothetical protein
MWDRSRPLHPAWSRAASIVAGALLLLWPVGLNRYPMLFSDTDAFLVQGGEWFAIWDKPFVYGPALTTASAGISLLLPALLQGLAVSAVLWLVAGALQRRGPLRHLLLCAVLAAGSAAPWFAGLLMPDIWAPVAVLCLALLGFAELPRVTRLGIVVVATFAIAVHLAHLPVAACCAVVVVVLAWRRTAWVAAPIVLAVALLLATNLAVFSRFSVSPHGAVFALARLAGDGLVEGTIAARCPQANWRLCGWQGRLPRDSDDFLWSGDGPVWSGPGGPIALAPEAAAIVAATIRRDPVGVARAALGNTIEQLHRVALGDVLTAAAMGPRIGQTVGRFMGPGEQDRLLATRQAQDTLAPVAIRLNAAHVILLVLGALISLGTTIVGPPTARGLAVCILVGILANAAATGALSGPHDRYQARIAWIVLIPAILLTPPTAEPFRPRAPRPPKATSAPASQRRRAAFRSRRRA